jgi:hypothetical protein
MMGLPFGPGGVGRAIMAVGSRPIERVLVMGLTRFVRSLEPKLQRTPNRDD